MLLHKRSLKQKVCGKSSQHLEKFCTNIKTNMENNLEQLHVSNCDFHYSVLFSVYINFQKNSI